MTELLCNNDFVENKRKKERRRQILCCRGRAVSNSGDTTASIDLPSSIGNTQKYLVSPYMSKMNLLVGDIRV